MNNLFNNQNKRVALETPARKVAITATKQTRLAFSPNVLTPRAIVLGMGGNPNSEFKNEDFSEGLQAAGSETETETETEEEDSEEEAGERNESHSEGGKFYSFRETSKAEWANEVTRLSELFNKSECSPALRFALKAMYLKLSLGISAMSFNMLITVTKTLLSELGLPKNTTENIKEFRLMRKRLKGLPCKIYRRVCCGKGCGVVWQQHEVCEGFKEVGQLGKPCPSCGEVERARHGFVFISLREKIKKLFLSRTFCGLVTSHAAHTPTPGVLEDIWDGSSWKGLKDSGFLDEPRNLVFLFTLDGVKLKKLVNDSVWPLMLAVLNLPPTLRLKNTMWSNVGVGAQHMDNRNMKSFLEFLVEEFRILYEHGVEVYDTLRGTFFTVRAVMFMLPADYECLMTVLQLKRAPAYLACPECFTVGNYMHSTMVYEDFHEFLSHDNALRTTLAENAFKHLGTQNERVEKAFESRPDYRTDERRAKAESEGKKKMVEDGILGEFSLSGIPYLSPFRDILPDGFHVFQNVAKRLREVLKGDLNSAGNQEAEIKRGRRSACCPSNFILSQSSQDLVDALLTQRKGVPSGVVERTKPLFNRSGDYLKGHDAIAMLGPLLQWALRHVRSMKPRNFRAIAGLLCVLQQLRRTYYLEKELPMLQQRIAEALVRIHLYFPFYMCTISVHMLLHLPEIIARFGPLRGYMNYSAERAMGHAISNSFSSAGFEVELMNNFTAREALVDVNRDRHLCENVIPDNPEPGVKTASRPETDVNDRLEQSNPVLKSSPLSCEKPPPVQLKSVKLCENRENLENIEKTSLDLTPGRRSGNDPSVTPRENPVSDIRPPMYLLTRRGKHNLVQSLIDGGASASCIPDSLVSRLHLKTVPLVNPRTVVLADGEHKLETIRCIPNYEFRIPGLENMVCRTTLYCLPSNVADDSPISKMITLGCPWLDQCRKTEI
eukprot:Nk52_evm1s2355 gene=Nk52_evmTU1s2355